MPESRLLLNQFTPLFFSGGTALNGLARELCKHTQRATYIITPFDSGGSSAALRACFEMPAVGDLRNRILAIADNATEPARRLIDLLSYRLPREHCDEASRFELKRLVEGRHPLLDGIEAEEKRYVVRCLVEFDKHAPADFDLAAASIGNLVICGEYLSNGRNFSQAINCFVQLVHARGRVLPVVEDNLHLSGRIRDGRVVSGQHRLTAKEASAASGPIEALMLSESVDDYRSASCQINNNIRNVIQSADLICYPPGSFFTSVLANLLPSGIIEAIAESDCPKVYVPNVGVDPEQNQLDGADLVSRLRTPPHTGFGAEKSAALLTHVLLHEDQTVYATPFSADILQQCGGLTLEFRSLVTEQRNRYQPELLMRGLYEIAARWHQEKGDD